MICPTGCDRRRGRTGARRFAILAAGFRKQTRVTRTAGTTIEAADTRTVNRVFRACGLWLLACGLPGLPAHAQPDVDELVTLLEGSYTSEGVVQTDDTEDPLLTDRHVRVSAPTLGEHVMYWQLNSGPEQKVYRQRLLVFEPGAEPGTVRQVTWSLPEPASFVNAWESPAAFAGFTREDVEQDLPPSCAQLWRRRDDGWYGRVDPAVCRIWSERRQAWRRIEGEAFVTADNYLTAERGFDDAGTQVFGTAPDQYYVLKRR